MKAFLKNISVVIGAIAFTTLVSCNSAEKNNSNTSKNKTIQAIDTAKPVVKNNWEYSKKEDKMTSGKIYYASSTSPDIQQFEFPYNGGSTVYFIVRNEEGGNNVTLAVTKGQFMTSVMQDKKIRMRFDDSKPISLTYVSPSDGSKDVIFLDHEKEIISMLKTAKHLIIEAEFYNEGNRQINFDVEGFKWEH